MEDAIILLVIAGISAVIMLPDVICRFLLRDGDASATRWWLGIGALAALGAAVVATLHLLNADRQFTTSIALSFVAAVVVIIVSRFVRSRKHRRD